ncbi:universal stress protein [Spirosoma aureum]|uniref:Universal stress protein n=1 Tax=Spirosoma aureum TaxID=2692134 RepID=A0A6G9ARN3_9BACT|nr:universal stress protein [Spirosoma aureum]QIP15137.1 universal stress protein [Spirosoma aureum]
MKKILLPTDFSETSKNAIRCAIRYFANISVEFVLLNATDKSAVLNRGHQSTNLNLQTEADLRALGEKLFSGNGLVQHTFRVVVMAMAPKAAITLMLQNESFDWVIVGTTGTSKANAFGNLATALIRLNRCNVLIVPFSSQPDTPLLNVLFATDYQPLGTGAVNSLHALVGIHHAELTFLTILAKKTLQVAPEKSIRDAYQAPFTDLTINEAIESHIGLRSGIEDYIDSHNVDLLIVTCHHRSLLDVLLRRSLTHQLANKPLIPLAVLADPDQSLTGIVERSVKGEVLL